ncbi:MAG: LysR family transcriptional regulator [Gammaproteobacteria bacterium]|nr:MAG: LysR family transcriptional regulator [Gammaproteobacteria bacterium]
MDRFEDLRTFVRVVEAGSFTGAAERLQRAKSAVSRRVSELEDRLGVQLLNRTTRRLDLTATGRNFYTRCVRLLSDLEEAELAVSSEHASLRGTLRIASPMSFGILHLADAINDFLSLHQDLRLEADLNDRRANLIEDGFDVAIRLGALADSSLIARRLAPMRRVTCASPAYLERFGTPRSPDDLVNHTGLSYSNIPDSARWQYRCPNGERRAARIGNRMRVNNGDMLLSAARHGLGVVVSPTFLAYRDIEQGALVPILTEYALPEDSAYAVYPHGRHLSYRVRVFIDFLAERFGERPYWDRFLFSDS